ncbi:unnamed protein product [Mytilus edulis]|uniref:Fibrinogen C-terminal domain-containing protein n=1 Tax=Mytilus edulis TaxID=6550 RepID=A0A8S3QPU3_MYTED|nr:unnamed protein product [Mytilus edulis]
MKFCCFPYLAVLCLITTLNFSLVNAIDEETFETKGSTIIVQTENTTDVYCQSIIGCADMCLSDPQCCLASYSKAASTCRIDTSERCCAETETLDEWSLIQRKSYQRIPIDCNDIPDTCPSGVYKVFPNQTEGFDVYCEMNIDEGHWTVSNSLEHHNGHRFSTKDSDNDNHPGNCATLFPGAWWFDYCVTSDLNGQYFLKTPDSAHRGVYWRSWKGINYSLKGSLMMMRRVLN